MACHFSPYGTGLTNLPPALPKGSMLILNDRTPIHGHDPVRIADTLAQVISEQSVEALLLDFQRPGCEEALTIAAALTGLPCCVAVTDLYARDLQCPVFLPPVPLRIPLEEHLAPWHGRQVWLDMTLEGEAVTVDKSGSRSAPLPPGSHPECPLQDGQLACHYRIDADPQQALFTLRRTEADLRQLLEQATSLGVTRAVGLYQEFATGKAPK